MGAAAGSWSSGRSGVLLRRSLRRRLLVAAVLAACSCAGAAACAVCTADSCAAATAHASLQTASLLDAGLLAAVLLALRGVPPAAACRPCRRSRSRLLAAVLAGRLLRSRCRLLHRSSIVGHACVRGCRRRAIANGCGRGTVVQLGRGGRLLAVLLACTRAWQNEKRFGLTPRTVMRAVLRQPHDSINKLLSAVYTSICSHTSVCTVLRANPPEACWP